MTKLVSQLLSKSVHDVIFQRCVLFASKNVFSMMIGDSVVSHSLNKNWTLEKSWEWKRMEHQLMQIIQGHFIVKRCYKGCSG